MNLNLNHQLWWNMLLGVLEIGACFVLGTLVKKLISFLARKAKAKGVLTFLASFCNLAMKIIGIIIALDQIGVSMNLIVGALSALGVGISLALKDNMASVASGLQILLTKPFVVGDYIKVGKYEGIVASIEMTYTILDTADSETLVVPNNNLITKNVLNYSSLQLRRVVIEYPCTKQEIGKNEKALLEAAKECSLVVKEPKPEVIIASFKMDQAVLELSFYCRNEDYWACNAEVMDMIHLLEMSHKMDDGPALEANPQDAGSLAAAITGQKPDAVDTVVHQDYRAIASQIQDLNEAQINAKLSGTPINLSAIHPLSFRHHKTDGGPSQDVPQSEQSQDAVQSDQPGQTPSQTQEKPAQPAVSGQTLVQNHSSDSNGKEEPESADPVEQKSEESSPESKPE